MFKVTGSSRLETLSCLLGTRIGPELFLQQDIPFENEHNNLCDQKDVLHVHIHAVFTELAVSESLLGGLLV